MSQTGPIRPQLVPDPPSGEIPERPDSGLPSHPNSAASLIEDLGRIARLASEHGLEEFQSNTLRQAILGQVDSWRGAPREGEDTRAQIQRRQWAYQLLSGSAEAMGEEIQTLRDDLMAELDRDAAELERELPGTEAAAQAIRALLATVLEANNSQSDTERRRQIQAIALEAYLMVGDLESAEHLLYQIRQEVIPSPLRGEGQGEGSTPEAIEAMKW